MMTGKHRSGNNGEMVKTIVSNVCQKKTQIVIVILMVDITTRLLFCNIFSIICLTACLIMKDSK